MEDTTLTLQLPSGPLLRTSWLPVACSSTLDEEIRLICQYLCHISQRRNRFNSLLRLPAELQFLIMDELVDFSTDTATKLSPQRDLESCSLVCSALLPYARARLLPCLRLDKPDAFLKAVRMFKDILPESRPQPRAVYLTDKQEETEFWKLSRTPDGPQWDELRPSIVDMMRGLPSVKQLRIHGTRYNAVDQPTLLFSALGQLTVPSWSHISHLTLNWCDFDCMHTVLNLVLQFSSLTVLELVYSLITPDGTAHIDLGLPSQKLALHRLCVTQSTAQAADRDNFSTEDCILRLSEHLLPHSLHELEFNLPRTPKGSIVLRNIIERCGRSLLNLRVHVHIDYCVTKEEALASFSNLTGALLLHAPNLRTVTYDLPWDHSESILDCVVRLLERTPLVNLEGISMFIAGMDQACFCLTCVSIARIIRAVRGRVRIAYNKRADPDPLELEPEEDWQQRHRGSSTIMRYVEGRSFMVARDVYEFDGEDDESVLVHVETEVDKFTGTRNFHALEIVRCLPGTTATMLHLV